MPKVNTKKRHHCTGPAPSEEVAPWNTDTARDQALPEDNRTLYPKDSLFVVNKDVKDCKNTCIVVICTNVEDVEDCKNTCIVVICTNIQDVEDSKILVFNSGSSSTSVFESGGICTRRR